jgi:sulfate adenylyltransferase
MRPAGLNEDLAPESDLVTWRLTARQQCDYELIANGAFAPLVSFLGREDYEAVCRDMRLADGTLWPIPVMLDVPEDVVRACSGSTVLLLRDEYDRDLAFLSVNEAWQADHLAEAGCVLDTTDPAHPWVSHLMHRTHPWYVSGDLRVLRTPLHLDLPPLVHSPAEVRADFERRGWTRVMAFNTRNPMHGAHRALVLRAAETAASSLFIHPVVGPTRPGDVPATIRARCYQAIMRTLDPEQAKLSLLPLAMRMAGPREAVWHAIIRRNYGATALVVGRDHAGPGADSAGRPFYHEYAAQHLVGTCQSELGIEMIAAQELVYVDGLGYLTRDEIPPDKVARPVSGTLLRRYLAEGRDVPPWLAPPEVAAELARSLPLSGRSPASP